MKLSIRFAAATALGFSLGACATITRGTTTSFVVESTPPGATVRTSSGFSCPATPCVFKMPRKDPFEVTASKAGYKNASSYVRTQIAGAGGAGMAGNIIFGGIIGVGVDATSGAMNDLSPNPLHIVLEKKDAETIVDKAAAGASAPGTQGITQ
ncbi:translation initiation factor 2 [Phenylobacterium sp.]|uniref:translation initiation factor 2 n=1 Tax=Phenylobacterium sp. TaxID=1871053 RepID=UPI002733EC03|nr:translation initiation factor 2 [Phenylobacterium sp.]MDP3658884.1 translation initiation factor 2 [Phenylobacterium sp.]